MLRGELARALQAAAVEDQALRGVHVAGRPELALDQRQQLRVLLQQFAFERRRQQCGSLGCGNTRYWRSCNEQLQRS